MTRIPIWITLLALVSTGTSCGGFAKADVPSRDTVLLNKRLARLDKAMANLDTIAPDKPVALWKLPDQLREISGLALTADGRLLAHGDERGVVYEVDYRRGIVVKEFTLSSPTVRADFEAITVAGDAVMMLTSRGVLYRFLEGAKDASVEYTVRDTGLGSECEFEGMTFDSAANTLLLACKNNVNKALKDDLVIFRLTLGSDTNGKYQKPTRLVVPMDKIIAANGWKGFHPSDITIDPFTGNYVMVASIEKAIAAITPTGAVVFSRPLPKGHDQAEGLAITKDHLLIISDEAKDGPGQITLYRWP